MIVSNCSGDGCGGPGGGVGGPGVAHFIIGHNSGLYLFSHVLSENCKKTMAKRSNKPHSGVQTEKVEKGRTFWGVKKICRVFLEIHCEKSCKKKTNEKQRKQLRKTKNNIFVLISL